MTYKSVRRELDSTKQGFGRWRKGSLVWSSLKNIIYLREWRKEVKGNKYCMDQSWRWAMTISGIKFHLSTCVCTRAHTHTHSVTRMLRNLCPSQNNHTHSPQWQGCSGTCVPPSVCACVCAHTHTQNSVTRMLRNLCPSQPQWSLEKGEVMGILSSFSGLRSLFQLTLSYFDYPVNWLFNSCCPEKKMLPNVLLLC